MESYEAEDGSFFLEEGDQVRIISSSGDEVSLDIAAVLGYAKWHAGQDAADRATDREGTMS